MTTSPLVCPSCGVAWVDHLGIEGTCAKLQKAVGTLRVVMTALATGKGDNSVVESSVALIRRTLEGIE